MIRNFALIVCLSLSLGLCKTVFSQQGDTICNDLEDQKIILNEALQNSNNKKIIDSLEAVVGRKDSANKSLSFLNSEYEKTLGLRTFQANECGYENQELKLKIKSKNTAMKWGGGVILLQILILLFK